MKTTKSMTPFSVISVHGFTKLKEQGIRLNLIAEPIAYSQLLSSIQCTPTYCKQEPGSSKITVGLRNV